MAAGCCAAGEASTDRLRRRGQRLVAAALRRRPALLLTGRGPFAERAPGTGQAVGTSRAGRGGDDQRRAATGFAAGPRGDRKRRRSPRICPAVGAASDRPQPGRPRRTQMLSSCAASATPPPATPPRSALSAPVTALISACPCRSCWSARTTGSASACAAARLDRGRPARPGLKYVTADDDAPSMRRGEAAAWVRERRQPAFLHLRVVRLMCTPLERSPRTAAPRRSPRTRPGSLTATARPGSSGVAGPGEIIGRYESMCRTLHGGAGRQGAPRCSAPCRSWPAGAFAAGGRAHLAARAGDDAARRRLAARRGRGTADPGPSHPPLGDLLACHPGCWSR